ncbi:hypothetical protein COV20_05080 [Candidatus Woesearchaeota archaeon CG10_big_fil_rev_8_21_14_0_10_45_16]|nr:MAG: hypothetical protein COV20_05080 [Candidatus Woesearchaeota archaeon CG10_big_fil_rev_8_21_14_0_10_45_16]
MRFIKDAFKEVFSNKNYVILAVIFSIVIYSFNVLLHNYRLVAEFDLKLTWALLIGSIQSMPLLSYLYLSTVSILTGITLSLAIYQIRRQIKQAAGAGMVAIIMGVIAPGCSSCALGLIGFLGLSSIIGYLPFKGLEIGVLGITLLGVSIIYLCKKITTKSCKA